MEVIMFDCNNLSDLLLIFLIWIRFIYCFLYYVPGILKILQSMFPIHGTGNLEERKLLV